VSGALKETAFATLLAFVLLFLAIGQAMAAEATVSESGSIAPAPEIIASIDVSGNKAVETGAVLERLRIRVGDVLNRKRISRDVRRLYATGFFKDVRVLGVVKDDGRHLTIEVVENPVLASITYEGLHEVKEKDLKLRLKLKPGHIFNKPELHKDITTIHKGYLKKGYYQVDVQPIQKIREDGRIDLTMKIIEGEVTRIKRIRFIGNKTFSADELREAIVSRTSGVATWFKDLDVFDRKRLDVDQQMLLQYYMNKGFLDAKVESTLLSLTLDKQWFYVTFSLHEGPRYRVNSIHLTGDLTPDKETLMQLVQLEEGELYSLDKLRKSLNAITTRVGDEGYAFATVTPLFQRHPEQRKVDISLEIEKGREVYVERIEINGNLKTEDQVVRREMRQMEGARFSSTNLETSKKRIGRLGYFKDVRVSMPKGSNPDKVKMKVGLEEKSTGSWTLGVGYSQLEKVFFRSSVKQDNFLGKGYATSLSGDVGARTQNFNTSITDPYFLGKNFSASLNAFKRQTRLQSLTSYKEDSYGGGVGFGLPIEESLTYDISYQYSNNTIFDVPAGSSAFLLAQVGRQTYGELTHSLTWDTRDQLIAATSGSRLSASVGFAGLGGSNRFITSGGEAATYIEIADGYVFNPLARFQYIRGYSGRTVPINRRLSLGGIGSVRGFDSVGISIRDPQTNDLIGGNKSASANLNMFFPFPYMRTSGLRGVVFIDAGDVEDFNRRFSFARARISSGLGFEWLSPIGPIGLSWGFVLRDRAGDQRRTFEFALGNTFQ